MTSEILSPDYQNTSYFIKGQKWLYVTDSIRASAKLDIQIYFLNICIYFMLGLFPALPPSVSLNQVNFFKPEQFRKSFKIYLWKLFKKKILNKEKLGLIHEIMLEHAKYIILRLLSFVVAEPVNDMPSVPVLNAAKTNIVDGSCSSDFTSR